MRGSGRARKGSGRARKGSEIQGDQGDPAAAALLAAALRTIACPHRSRSRWPEEVCSSGVSPSASPHDGVLLPVQPFPAASRAEASAFGRVAAETQGKAVSPSLTNEQTDKWDVRQPCLIAVEDLHCCHRYLWSPHSHSHSHSHTQHPSNGRGGASDEAGRRCMRAGLSWGVLSASSQRKAVKGGERR